ncbi:vacuolar-sorting protein SNF8-like [Mercenaria mercenaria]|uniref:vacuolar-sorting protein SNF8-like n=1 Tax=Mercenaria mercenaria TaxID=6596 RepID=UPI00234FB08D|nr:vacuolar-sorting protein SNF8-like [Mercenaria mercenaria]
MTTQHEGLSLYITDEISRFFTILGLISIEELKEKLKKSRSKKSQDVSYDDLLRAIKKLKALGNGFTVIPVGGTYMIQSVPGELSMDHTAVIQQAQSSAHVTKSKLTKDLKWEEERANRALVSF